MSERSERIIGTVSVSPHGGEIRIPSPPKAAV